MWFTGTVRIDPLFQAPDPALVQGASVTFAPGARTAWHMHPLGQTLIVTVGCGWAQRWGGPIEEIHPGDVVRFSPGEKHWHGATPTTAMTHIAIQEKHDGKAQGVANVQLAATEIVQKLVDRNAKRVKALEGYRGRRSYDLDYVGFPANLHATMIVDVKYTAPATKEFTVVSQSGSKWVIS